MNAISELLVGDVDLLFLSPLLVFKVLLVGTYKRYASNAFSILIFLFQALCGNLQTFYISISLVRRCYGYCLDEL